MVVGSSTVTARSARSSRSSSRGRVFFDFLSVLRARSVIMVSFPSTRKYGGRRADTLCPCRLHQQTKRPLETESAERSQELCRERRPNRTCAGREANANLRVLPRES